MTFYKVIFHLIKPVIDRGQKTINFPNLATTNAVAPSSNPHDRRVFSMVCFKNLSQSLTQCMSLLNLRGNIQTEDTVIGLFINRFEFGLDI